MHGTLQVINGRDKLVPQCDVTSIQIPATHDISRLHTWDSSSCWRTCSSGGSCSCRGSCGRLSSQFPTSSIVNSECFVNNWSGSVRGIYGSVVSRWQHTHRRIRRAQVQIRRISWTQSRPAVTRIHISGLRKRQRTTTFQAGHEGIFLAFKNVQDGSCLGRGKMDCWIGFVLE